MFSLTMGLRPKLVFSGAAVTIDGNSIAASSYSTVPVATMLVGRAPISNQSAVSNVAIGGQTVQQMTTNHTDVDAAWVSGKTNILIVWEIINNVATGRTGAQTFADLQAYVQAVKAVHPWKVVGVTGHPRFQNVSAGGFTLLQCNQEIVVANALLRANYKSIGFDQLADVVASDGPFAFTDYLNLAAYDTTYYSTSDGSDANGPVRVHWTDAAFTWALNNAICPALNRIRV